MTQERYFETLHLQLQLQLGARDGCDVIALCAFGTHLTDGLTVSVSIWRLAPLINVRGLQLVGMPSFTRYFAKMTSIYFILINSCQNALPIYYRVHKIIFVLIDLTSKLSILINLYKCNVTLGKRPSHDQRCVPMETPRTNCAVSENPLSMSTITFTFNDDVTC